MLRTPRFRTVAASLAVLCVAAPALARAAEPDRDDDDDNERNRPVTEVVITAQRLDEAREKIEPDLGSATYSLSNDAVEARPGGETTHLGPVLLQAPGVSRGIDGGLRIRGRGPAQYRINNVIIPAGAGDLGDALSARLADKVTLVSGALPAQYGLQGGSVVAITTKNGVYQAGGQAELYGGGRGLIQPAFEAADTVGGVNIFASGSYQRTSAGPPPPDASRRPLHDDADQIEGFVFLDRSLADDARVSLFLGSDDERSQLPHARGENAASLPPGDGFARPLTVGGVSGFPSEALAGSRREVTRYGGLSYLYADGPASLQISLFGRYATRDLNADGVGDILFTGLGQASATRDAAGGLQIEGAYGLGDHHTLRAGGVFSHERLSRDDRWLVLPVDAGGHQTSTTPLSVMSHTRLGRDETSLFLQDEWRPTDGLTLNLGLRFDQVSGPGGGKAVSPRANLVWTLADGLILHAGYAHILVPARLGGDGADALLLAGSTGAPASLAADPPRAETSDDFAFGLQWKAGALTIGADAYVRRAHNPLDETHAGARLDPVALNYADGRARGAEFSLLYSDGPLSAWANLAVSRSEGRRIVSGQLAFSPTELTWSQGRYARLNDDQTVTASAGAAYRLGPVKLSGALLYGSGLPATAASAPNGVDGREFEQIDLSAVWRADGLGDKPLDIRLDVINAADRANRFGDGTGLGHGDSAYAPRRGIFVGFEQAF